VNPIGPTEVATDLVEYLVVRVSGPDALAVIGPELLRIVDTSAIRVLDLALVRVDATGASELVELAAIEGFEDVRSAIACYGLLLSRHDVELVALALAPGDCAVVVVVEDVWAEPLAVAARTVGGTVHGGERIAPARVEAALARVTRRAKEQ
jgi:hypothetical protein